MKAYSGIFPPVLFPLFAVLLIVAGIALFGAFVLYILSTVHVGCLRANL